MSDEQSRKADPEFEGQATPIPDVIDATARRRRPIVIIVMAIVLLAVIAIAIAAVPGLLRPSARELLRDVTDRYARAEHIHTESVIEYQMAIGSMEQNMPVPASAWFSRPNSMRYETTGGMQAAKAVSDGRHLDGSGHLLGRNQAAGARRL